MPTGMVKVTVEEPPITIVSGSATPVTPSTTSAPTDASTSAATGMRSASLTLAAPGAATAVVAATVPETVITPAGMLAVRMALDVQVNGPDVPSPAAVHVMPTPPVPGAGHV